MTYNPTRPSSVSSVQDVLDWTMRELEALSKELAETTALELRGVNVEPLKPREGMIVHADGSDWDPGSGAGAYVYSGGVWVPLNTTALDADLSAIAALAGTGIAVRTASDVWALRSLVAPSAGITITNPAGIAGDPTFALANDLAALEALSGTNNIYYRSAADTWTSVTIGTGLSFSSGTLSASPTPGMVLISTQVASSSAQIDFTGLDSTYEAYEVWLSNVKPATDQVEFRMRVGTGAGPTYQADATDYYWQTTTLSGGVSAVQADASDNEMVLTFTAAAGLGNAAGENLTGFVRFGNPAASDFHTFAWLGTYRDSANVPRPFWGGGGYETAEAITAIRFLMSSGNIASGRFSLYGYRKS